MLLQVLKGSSEGERERKSEHFPWSNRTHLGREGKNPEERGGREREERELIGNRACKGERARIRNGRKGERE